MGRPEFFVPRETLPESRAQIFFEKPNPSSLILVSTSQTKEDCLGLALNGSGVKIERANVEIPERDWEEVFSRNNLGQYGHFPIIPQAIAYAKAKSIVDENPQARVIAADVVVLTEEGEILGKPLSLEAARIMIDKENRKTVTQTAGTAYWNGQEWFFGQTEVRMKRRHNEEGEIEKYIQTHSTAVFMSAGSLPITDQEVLETFYEKGAFSVLSFCFNQRNEKKEVSPNENYVGLNNHLLLIQTVNGLSPNLLRSMGIV